MKYLGRQDFAEGGYYPIGLHWGYIHPFRNLIRVEQYTVFRISTPFRREQYRLDTDRIEPHRLNLLAFAARPNRNFQSKFRYRLTYLWVPTNGS